MNNQLTFENAVPVVLSFQMSQMREQAEELVEFHSTLHVQVVLAVTAVLSKVVEDLASPLNDGATVELDS